MTVFIFLVWSSVVSIRSNLAGSVAWMSEAGKTIVGTIIWYQFLVLQLIAVVMLSTSISDEIYHKTLGLLMTTPITSFQIVFGKLLSKLFQLFLLLAIGFPLLAILRVFGGVPWGYVISSFCITLTAVLFAGALSLYFSIGSRYAYVVILKTIFVLAMLYLIIPIFIGSLILYINFRGRLAAPQSMTSYFTILTFCNPFLIMSLNTSRAIGQVSVAPFLAGLWPLHCAGMLFLTLLILARSVQVVRRVALRQATGGLDIGLRHKIKRVEQFSKGIAAQNPDLNIRAVVGALLVWKEMRTPLVEGGRTKNIIALAVGIIALLISYYSNFRAGALRENFAHVGYSLIFVLLGLITNIALSATSITGEKESSTWPILLTTPLSDWQIIIGKAVGALRKCIPFWLFLAGHLIIFTLLGYIHPAAIVHLGLIIAGLLVFLNGSGLYFSSRFRHTTAAVVANFAFVLVLWFGVPLLSGFIAQIEDYHNLAEVTISANPIVQTIVVMSGSSGIGFARDSLSVLRYEWPFGFCRSFLSTTAFLFCSMLFFAGLGLFFAWRAKCNLRRNIF